MNVFGVLVIVVITIFGLIPLLIGILMLRSAHRNKLHMERPGLVDRVAGVIDDIDTPVRRSRHPKSNDHKIAITILHTAPSYRAGRGNVVRLNR